MRPQHLHFFHSDGKYSTVQNHIRHMDSYISVWNFRFFKGAPWVCSKVCLSLPHTKIEKYFLLIYEELQCVKIIIHYLLLYLSAAHELLKGQ
jgi:hypothetical protein